jgi:N6-L-threonylcarbamoyladenine synthase
MAEPGKYQVLGRTLDDAAGEAFDKVARILGLGYPGGPHVQRVAAQANKPVDMPRAWLPDTFDFSFSGLKTAVLHRAHSLADGKNPSGMRGLSLAQGDAGIQLTDQQVADLASGFQESVVDVLVKKTARAAERFQAESVAVVGGVAANRALHIRMEDAISRPLFVSAPDYATDNAAMIAAAGYFAPPRTEDVDVTPNLSLAQ